MPAKQATPPASIDLELADQIAAFYADPLGFVLFAFPWGEPGPLERFSGPRPRQERFLIDLGDEIKARKFDGVTPVLPIRMAISSGHGEGKSALIGMLASFLMATRDGLLGTVTANTALQLSTKTWAAIETWHKYAICRHWFEFNTERFYRIGRRNDWFMTPQSCAEGNSEAFAGQHNVKSTSVYFFDEDSNVSDKIHEVAEGGLTDGESMMFRFGNCTRREGSFFQIHFGTQRDFWNRCTLGPSRNSAEPAGTRIWDAHDSPYANRDLLQEWMEEHGFDSDFYRVRVRGLAPKAGDTQFISADLISAAQQRIAQSLPDDPLVAGCDLAWGGNDNACIRFRKGCDARTIPPIKIRGELLRDENVMVMKLSEVLDREWDVGNGRRQKVEMLFIDAAGSCGPIVRRLRELGYKNIIEVNFGAHSPDRKYKFVRSFLYGKLREALPYLAIDKSPDLEADLSALGYRITKDTEILLELKQDVIKRLGHSTDDGDALGLTYYAPVRSKQAKEERERKRRPSSVVSAWS
jgi:hypothetical protein